MRLGLGEEVPGAESFAMDELEPSLARRGYFVVATLAAEETQHMTGARELGW